MEAKCDVAVVGGGPAGLLSAKTASLKGLDVIVLEEHSQVGIPSHCAGLVSVKGLSAIGLEPLSEFVQNEVKGARFSSPSGLTFEIEARNSIAFVLDRVRFDQHLSRQAINDGVELLLGMRVRKLLHSNNRISGVKDDSGSLYASSVVVDAEGVRSQFVGEAGLAAVDKASICPAMQFELANVNIDKDFVQVFVGKKYAPGFFAWAIPTGSDSVRVGLACNHGNVRFLLERFVEENFAGANLCAVTSGAVITGGPIKETCSNGFMVVGDAAGQTKPTTGGGVIMGGMCAIISGEAAAEAIRTRDTSSRALNKLYERKWRGALGREFSTMLVARRFFNKLSDNTLDRIFKIIIKERLAEEISSFGDMDFQSGVLRRLAKKGLIMKILPFLAGDFLKDAFTH